MEDHGAGKPIHMANSTYTLVTRFQNQWIWGGSCIEMDTTVLCTGKVLDCTFDRGSHPRLPRKGHRDHRYCTLENLP